MEVEIVRSKKRRKTVELKPTANGVRITIPSTATKADEQHYVTTLLRRYERKKNRPPTELPARARALAKAHDLRVPRSIEWSDNQAKRWGSCTPSTGTIRISSSVVPFPKWVVDYVIVHELAHLSILGHGPDFWALVNRYPLSERARGFLIAKGGEDDEPATTEPESTEAMDDEPRAEESDTPPVAAPDVTFENGSLFNNIPFR